MGLKESGLRGSLRSVSAGVGIPDSEDAQIWVVSDDLELLDGETVSTWDDRSDNGFDLTGSSTFIEDDLNGFPAVETESGDSDELDVSFDTITEPWTFFFVCRVMDTGLSDDSTLYTSEDEDFNPNLTVETDDGLRLRDTETGGDHNAEYNIWMVQIDSDKDVTIRQNGETVLNDSTDEVEGWDGFRIWMRRNTDLRSIELILYPSERDDIDSHESYLSDKYDVALDGAQS